MIIILVLILTRPEKIFLKEIKGESLSSTCLIVSLFVFFGVGFYGGFIQAGVSFIIIALTLIAGMSLVKINSLKLFIVLIYIFVLPFSFFNSWQGRLNFGIYFGCR